MTKTFTWLHLSDLHMGISTQDWLWPTLKHELFDDLTRMLEQTGNLDAVIFSGDLTQSGEREQFARLDEALGELWQLFVRRSCRPPLFCVPGNHDLVRPRSTDLSVMLLKKWWEMPEVQTTFWSEPEGPLRKTIANAFSNYSSWVEGVSKKIGSPQELSRGLVPGDFAASLSTSFGSVGLVGLNSSWLQLDGSEYEGRLFVHPKQINAVTDDDPVGWCRRHAFNVLITHHPENWQHSDSIESWRSEINPPGRFDLHMFGHMHLPDATSHAHGGDLLKKSLQGASIFGLEKFGGNMQRIHGYSIGRATADVPREIRVWPRRLIKRRGGDRKLVEDLALCSTGSNSFVFPGAILSAVTPSGDLPLSSSLQGKGSALLGKGATENILHKVRRYHPRQTANLRVRGVEQTLCRSALSEFRSVWIGAEWGSGFDGFVSSLQAGQSLESVSTYHLDAAAYTGRESFFAAIKEQFDFSFEAFCDALSIAGKVYLILEDIPVHQQIDGKQIAVAEDVESLTNVILQYCPELCVILHTRQLPVKPGIPAVLLKPLDEADLRAYVLDHPNGGEEFSSEDAIAKLFRHTDGVPVLVDAALKELEIITIDQLASVNHDLNRIDAGSDDVPEAIVKAVVDLSTSRDPMRRRAYDLLLALAGFPRGETLERVKRFNGSYPFFTAHARELIDRSLLLPSSISGEALGADVPAKLLVVPRPVRVYVRSQIEPEVLLAQNKRAADLYFGEKWIEGHIKPSVAERFKNAIGSMAELANATTIILRLFNDGLAQGDARAKKAALRIAGTFVSTVFDGDHYTIVETICADILREIGDDESESATRIRAAYAASLRMLGKHSLSRGILTGLTGRSGSNSLRQNILVDLAMVHQSLGESAEAVAVAKKIVSIDGSTNHALQAQAIIIEESFDENAREHELIKHEARCRKRGAVTVANNIAIKRVEAADDSSGEVDTAIEVVIASSIKEKDFYTSARAIVQKVALATRRKRGVSDKDKALLISAYQYIYNERLHALFDECHDALWALFESEGDNHNLFRLFRHSSLIWRLSGDESSEERYVRRLSEYSRLVFQDSFRTLDRERAYYQVRAEAFLPALGMRSG